MSAKKKDVFSEFIVGLFMIAVLGLLVYFTIVISGVDVLQGRQKVVARVLFTDVGGLKDHDNVMYRGTKVGTVERVNLSPTNLVVVMEINKDVVLRESCRIAVCNLSMLGGNYLLLEEGEGEILPLETTLFTGETPTDWMQDVSKIAKDIRNLTSGGELKGIVTNIEVASGKVLAIADRVERGEGTLGKLLSSDDSLYVEVADTVTEVKGTFANANKIVERVEKGEGTVGKLLSSDDTVYRDLQRTLASAGDIADKINRGEGVLGRLVSKDDPLGRELDDAVAAFRKACESVDAKDVIASAEKLLANLNDVAEKLKTGDGTLGKLINETELYDEIQGLAKDVRQTLDNFRDTTPISTFGSLIMGGL
ncbi:MAG: MCE family protein [Kiritimatiellae bacterium]|nr:MCE family protein [Kiritimatiellia bacterium]